MKKFYCPVNGWDCPYWKRDGTCSMVDEGDDPVKECDDVYMFWGDEPEGNYFVDEPDYFIDEAEGIYLVED